jgi:hypothetical protein
MKLDSGQVTFTTSQISSKLQESALKRHPSSRRKGNENSAYAWASVAIRACTSAKCIRARCSAVLAESSDDRYLQLSYMLKCEELVQTSCLATPEYLKKVKYPSCSYPKKQMCSDVLLSSVHTSSVTSVFFVTQGTG